MSCRRSTPRRPRRLPPRRKPPPCWPCPTGSPCISNGDGDWLNAGAGSAPLLARGVTGAKPSATGRGRTERISPSKRAGGIHRTRPVAAEPLLCYRAPGGVPREKDGSSAGEHRRAARIGQGGHDTAGRKAPSVRHRSPRNQPAPGADPREARPPALSPRTLRGRPTCLPMEVSGRDTVALSPAMAVEGSMARPLTGRAPVLTR